MKYFVNGRDTYKRDLDMVGAYVQDSAMFLHKQTGAPMEQCVSFVKQSTAKGGRFEMKDPEVLCLSKDKPGERVQKVITFSEYLENVIDNNHLMSPTMAVYIHPDVKRSVLAEYISENIKKRGRIKHEMFTAEMAGDKDLAVIKDNEQNSTKVKNNALSGAAASASTPLVNKSSHSSLTSTCRSATGYGNANNEKFMFGNRHYWAPEVVVSNILSTIRKSDYGLIETTMAAFGIVYPTVEQTMECISYSTNLYWRNALALTEIRTFVEKLSDIDRAAFVYTGDLYHLAKYNDKVVRDLLTEISSRVTTPIENPKGEIETLDTDMAALVSLLCAADLDGTTISEAVKKDLPCIDVLGATAKQIRNTLEKYAMLIKAFWISQNVPPSVASLPDGIRRGAITSDTDSTIFTVQSWTEWYVGKLDFSERSKAVSYAVTYLASQTIIHVLAIMSANMGVRPSQIHQFSMKNEYAFPVFALTSRAKHYYAYMSAREGNVFKENKLEVKGVALKSSNSPPHVIKQAHELICFIMDSVIADMSVSLKDVFDRVVRLENEIRASVEGGDLDYMTRAQIKTIESYKNPMSSAYLHYLMWEEVFADKYGHTEAPTYGAVKVSVDLDNPTKLRVWLESLEDRALAERLGNWLKEKGKNHITSMLLPAQVVGVSKIPKEIVAGVNIRKLISEVMEPFYLILESLGIFVQDPNYTRLISDFHTL